MAEESAVTLQAILRASRRIVGGAYAGIEPTGDGGAYEVLDGAPVAMVTEVAARVAAAVAEQGPFDTPSRLEVEISPVAADHRPGSGEPSGLTVLVVPLVADGERLGWLWVSGAAGGSRFDGGDEAAVAALAEAAATVVAEARRREEDQRRVDLQGALQSVTTALLAGTAAEEILHLVALHARELVAGVLATVVVRSDTDEEELTIVAADGGEASSLIGERFPAEGSVSGDVMRSGRPLILADAGGDQRVLQPAVRRGKYGPSAFVPLYSAAQPFGTLLVARPRGGAAFTTVDLGVVASFAAQASIALEYGRAARDRQRVAVLQDQERIIKELNERAIQRLFGCTMTLSSVASHVEDPVLQGRLREAVDDLDAALDEIRAAVLPVTGDESDRGDEESPPP